MKRVPMADIFHRAQGLLKSSESFGTIPFACIAVLEAERDVRKAPTFSKNSPCIAFMEECGVDSGKAMYDDAERKKTTWEFRQRGRAMLLDFLALAAEDEGLEVEL